MRESEAALRQLIQERNEAEREKWTILRHARDEAERCLSLTTQLTSKDAKIDQLQEELTQVLLLLESHFNPFFSLYITCITFTKVRAQLSRQQQQSRRTSPTVAITNQQQQQRLPPATSTSTRQRSSISSMDSAAVISDACDEPLYSRIDHSSSESHHAPNNNHDGTSFNQQHHCVRHFLVAKLLLCI